MNNFPSKEIVTRLREQYPRGCRIELVQTDDPFTNLRPGDRGTVDFIDDAGNLHLIWDCGATLGLIWGVDKFRKVVA